MSIALGMCPSETVCTREDIPPCDAVGESGFTVVSGSEMTTLLLPPSPPYAGKKEYVSVVINCRL